jgi:glyoxylase-like metal-dependent hydrolase (beta-lactamase superfamily II)
VQVGELASGLWWWTARHPDWEPTQSWDPEVRCFYVEADDATLVVDPLVPPDDADRFWSALDRDVDRRALPVAVLLTQAAHGRSAGEIASRYGAEVWGHDAARAKVEDAAFHAIESGDAVPGGRVLEFDQEEGGSGTPLYLESHRAVAVGDVFISRDDGLHVWWGHGASGDGWYSDRLLPSLESWLELPIEHVLVAHGPQVGPDELRAALKRPPDRGE